MTLMASDAASSSMRKPAIWFTVIFRQFPRFRLSIAVSSTSSIRDRCAFPSLPSRHRVTSYWRKWLPATGTRQALDSRQSPAAPADCEQTPNRKRWICATSTRSQLCPVIQSVKNEKTPRMRGFREFSGETRPGQGEVSPSQAGLRSRRIRHSYVLYSSAASARRNFCRRPERTGSA